MTGRMTSFIAISAVALAIFCAQRDRTHGSIASQIADENDPARLAIIEFIKRQSDARRTSPAR